MAKSAGQWAYEAYGETRQWKTYQGDPMPTWEEQSDELRAAWEAAARAVTEHGFRS